MEVSSHLPVLFGHSRLNLVQDPGHRAITATDQEAPHQHAKAKTACLWFIYML